jgi:hypothetical protein
VGLLIALLGAALSACVDADETAEAARASEQVVRLIVDYGDGVEKHFTRLGWRDGATVWDVLQDAARHPRGIQVRHRGNGATTLIIAIDEAGNEPGTGRNWIYRVNDRVGERSAGICPVQAGDTILWRFETYR